MQAARPEPRPTERAIEAVKELGVEVYYPEKKAFMDKVAPMYELFEGTGIGELVEAIRAIQ